MTISWSKELEVGEESIDSQHKEIIEMFNALMSACGAGRGKDELENALDFLCDYTVKHFSSEEMIQRQINYPDFSKHKQLHDDFKVRVTNLSNLFKQEGPSSVIVVKLSTDVGEWLLKHIRHEDKKLGPYLQK